MAGALLRSAGRVAAAALLCASLAGAQESDGLYYWVTERGDVQVGPTPPPGVKAVPWDPSAPPPTAPPAAAAQPATPKPASAAVDPAAAAASDACDPHRALADELAASRGEIARLEKRIAELEATDVANSFTRCKRHAIRGYDPDCAAGAFDRDAELESAREALGQAQDELSDVEARAAHAGVPRECLTDPRD